MRPVSTPTPFDMKRVLLFIFPLILATTGFSRAITGTVVNLEDREPLIGATVRLVGTTRGTVTDIDGNFWLEVPNKRGQSLLFEYSGFHSIEIDIDSYSSLVVGLSKKKLLKKTNSRLLSKEGKEELEPIAGRKVYDPETGKIVVVDKMEVPDNSNSQPQVDYILPAIDIQYPPDQFRTMQPAITINGRVTDEKGIKNVSIDGQRIELNSEGFFQYNLHLSSYGLNTVQITATDNSDNTQTQSLSIIRQQKAVVQERRLALVIGNATYQRAGNLRNPINDAEDMTAALESLGFEVLQYRDLTLPKFRQALIEFGRRLPNYDVGLFYYSGHGLSSYGDNYLIPIDAVLHLEEHVVAECVNIKDIMTYMDAAQTNVNILVYDACRNNPFAKSWGRSLVEPNWIPVTAPSGTFIAYATSPEKVAHDGWGDNGAYTSELLKHIATPGLPIEQLFKRVRASLDRTLTQKKLRLRQEPWENTSLIGEFYFVK